MLSTRLELALVSGLEPQSKVYSNLPTEANMPDHTGFEPERVFLNP
ncbi:hypothetical protein [Mesomycoplasma hyopneumoniae]|nr:hypothetical protein [Mesomycoplasma hyopneumoniae]